MAISVTKVIEGRTLNKRMTVSEAILNTYATGGVAVTPNQLGLSAINKIPNFIGIDETNDVAYIGHYDATAGKIQAFYCDYSASTDAALIEVATDADLSDVTFDVTAYGV